MIVEAWSPLRSRSSNRGLLARYLSTGDGNCWKKLVSENAGSAGDDGGLYLYVQDAPPTEILSSKDLDALKQQWRANRKEPSATNSRVLVVFYFYVHRPRSPGPRVPAGIQHTSTAVLHVSHLFSKGGTVTLHSTHHAETKWIGRARQHVRLDVAFRRPDGSDQWGGGQWGGGSPFMYWEDRLREIWERGILPDIKWVQQPGISAEEFELRCQAMTPLSVPVHGVPAAYGVEVDGLVYNDQFAVSKGLTAQSLWYIPDEQIVTDEWIRGMLGDILSLRGASMDDFTRPTRSRESRQKFLSDVVKLVTYHASTWPYFPDMATVRAQDGVGEEWIPIDDMDPARIKPGDCEDVSSISVQIACDILRRRNVSCPIIKMVQYYLAMLGVPCGVSGRVLAPSNDGSVLHVYGMFVPLPLFESLVSVDVGAGGGRYVLETYALNPVDIPLHCALIEGTVLSSPFYTAREHVDERKASVCGEMERVLSQVAGEDNIMQWKNYCVPQAWSLRPEVTGGRYSHLEILRIFPCMPELILGPSAATRVNKSYAMMTGKTIGVNAKDFLARFPSLHEFESHGWSAQSTFTVPDEVIDLEKDIIRQFYRPVTTIRYHADGCERDVNKWIDSSESEEAQVLDDLRARFCHAKSVPVNPNDRAILYVWKLVRGECHRVLTEMLTQIPALKVVRIQRLGHGYAVVFSITKGDPGTARIL